MSAAVQRAGGSQVLPGDQLDEALEQIAAYIEVPLACFVSCFCGPCLIFSLGSHVRSEGFAAVTMVYLVRTSHHECNCAQEKVFDTHRIPSERNYLL